MTNVLLQWLVSELGDSCFLITDQGRGLLAERAALLLRAVALASLPAVLPLRCV